MSKNDLDYLFDQLNAISFGFGPVFRNLQLPITNYPPHNIIQDGDNAFTLEMAVAGFKKDEIAITEHQGELKISGLKDSSLDENYQYRGIGRRSFEKKFKLAEFVEVIGADLQDGILSISLVRNIPKQEQPKVIAIK